MTPRGSTGNTKTVKVKVPENDSRSTLAMPTLLTITPATNVYNTVTLSKYDASDETSQWYAIGKFNYEYSSDASICSSVYLMMNDASSTYQYQNWFDDVFADTRLQFRDSNDQFVQYVYANNSDKSRFTIEDAGLSTSGYFYVEGRSTPTVASTFKNKKLYVYLNRMCAEKDGSSYYWMGDDANGQNAYFKASADSSAGMIGGWAQVND